jgi:hypothetical protein
MNPAPLQLLTTTLKFDSGGNSATQIECHFKYRITGGVSLKGEVFCLLASSVQFMYLKPILGRVSAIQMDTH